MRKLTHIPNDDPTRCLAARHALAVFLAACIFLLAASPARAETLVDIFGRKVEAPAKVERLIALGSSMAWVTYLGAQDMAVGVEDMEKKFSTKPYMIVNKERVRDLPAIGKAGPVRIPNYEEIIRLKPDVIFVVSTDRGEPDLIQRKTRIPVFAVGYGITSFDEPTFLRSIELVGRVLGRQDKADTLVRYVRSLHDQLDYAPSDAEAATAYAGGLSYKGNQGILSTSADFFPMNMAHVRNTAAGAGSSAHCFVNKEFLLRAKPPLLFLDGNGMRLIEDAIRSDPGYHERITALREGNAYTMIPNVSYFINPEMLYANAFFLAKVAYPEAYPDLDPVAKADEILATFNGEPLYRFYEEHGFGFGRVQFKDGQLQRISW